MGIKNTKNAFGWMARGVHWFSAFLILGLLILGFWMGGLDNTPFKLDAFGVHKSFGILALALVVFRLLWRLFNAPPGALPAHSVIERFLSKTVHIVLYIFILSMPLSGLIMSSAGGFPAGFFGLFEFPALTGKDEGLHELFGLIHWGGAFVLVGALALHIAGALKHHFLDKDTTLERMGVHPVLVAVLILLFVTTSGFAAREIIEEIFGDEHEAQLVEGHDSVSEGEVYHEMDLPGADIHRWVIDPKNSVISFTFQQYGQPVSGRFERWGGVIYFDPQDLAQSRVMIRIDMSGIKTGSSERDGQARGEEWFAVDDYAEAVFKSESFQALEPNRYLVQGALDLRGVSLPLSFPFDLQITSGENGGTMAVMEADILLNRLDFGIGLGPWKSTEAIGNPVQVHVSLRADSAP